MAEDARAVGPITNFDELRAWLEVAAPRQRALFASRCALRELPYTMAVVDQAKAPYSGMQLVLTSMRATLLSGVIGTWPTEQTPDPDNYFSAVDFSRSKLSKSAMSAFSHAKAAVHSHKSTTEAIKLAESYIEPSKSLALGSFKKTVAFRDAEKIRSARPGSDLRLPVWGTKTISAETGFAWETFRSRTDPEMHWRFWIDWYQSMLLGHPLPWDLQRRIAFEISQQNWFKGVGAVAKQIREIEKDFHSRSENETIEEFEREYPFRGEESARDFLVITPPEALKVKENLQRRAEVRLDESGTFQLTTISITSKRAVRLAVDRVIDAFDDAKRICGHNGFNDQRIEVVILDRAHSKYLEDAERLAFDYTDVQLSLNKAMKDELPADSALQILYTALRVAVTEIAEADPGIAAALERNYRTDPEEPSEDDDSAGPGEEEALLLTDAMRVFPDITDEPLGERLEEGLAEVLTGEIVNETPFDARPIGGPRLRGPRRSVVSELAAITADMYLKLRAAPEETKKKLAEHYDSETSKAVGVTARYGGALALIGAVAKYLASLLGF